MPADPVLRGRVEADSTMDFQGGTVVLHRVAPGEAGEIDSVGVGPSGEFSLSLPSVPDPGGRSEVYFASLRHQGVLYFGPPIATAAQLDSLYRIQVHDTAAAPAGGAEIPLAVRFLLLDPLPDGEGEGWRVTDLLQVRNEGTRTLVASEGPVWRYPLPAGAADVEVGAGDVAPGALEVAGDSVRLSMPLPPGDRQVVLRYRVPELPLSVPAPGRTGEMEILVREPAPPLEVSPLSALASVEMEPGVTYRRFAANDLEDAVVRLAEGEEPFQLPVRGLMVALGLVLTAAGVWAVLRRPKRAEPVPSGGPPAGAATTPTASERRQALLLEVARLDEARERGEVEEEAWRRRREDLLARVRRIVPETGS